MAKTKAELLKEAKKLKLDVTAKNTVAEILAAIEQASKVPKEEPNEASKAETEKETAKAGKRSEKGLKEAEKKVEKIERQKHADEQKTKEDAKPKHTQKPPRSRLERRGKKYREASKQIDKSKQYTVKEALDLAIKTSFTKFDATVEVHIRLNVDPKQADQNIRDNVVLPAGSGKKVRVAVFADDDQIKSAKAAGADIAGSDDFLTGLDKGQTDFDVLIATPNLMSKLAKYARILGPKGLMPNPKSGTVTNDIEKAIKQAKAGKIEYRVDSTGIVHVGVGKVSFGAEKLDDNVKAIFSSIKQNKPASIKGTYVNTIAVTTSMGPSVSVLPSEL